mmetsp:Transcript_25310/g.80076  ORF Transcript_25310/g.80076 Transcript_25310/m.80076 type:complete len:118 (+) Transcript_25310:1117-1470(+)
MCPHGYVPQYIDSVGSISSAGQSVGLVSPSSPPLNSLKLPLMMTPRLRSRVFTLSVHCQDNFPARKQASDLDVGLRSGAGDAEYMRAISEVVPGALQDFRPDLVLYDAGVRRNRYPC